MKKSAEQAAKWVYRGVWGVLTQWFRVPDQPPTLPALSGESIEAFQPSEGFLRYLKLQFWVALVVIDVAILIGWLVILVLWPLVGLALALPAFVLAVVPDIVAYVAIHLRYDTTWYVMSDRSLRIRRGIWLIRETTITFENVQNVTVRQGPIQRWFGIADVLVDTAGGGGSQQQGAHGGHAVNTHQGLIEGLADAQRIRDMLLARLKQSRTAGLGDESPQPAFRRSAWRPEHIAVLTEIRDAARTLAAGQDA